MASFNLVFPSELVSNIQQRSVVSCTGDVLSRPRGIWESNESRWRGRLREARVWRLECRMWYVCVVWAGDWTGGYQLPIRVLLLQSSIRQSQSRARGWARTTCQVLGTISGLDFLSNESQQIIKSILFRIRKITWLRTKTFAKLLIHPDPGILNF